ncbi:flagellar biosynthesis protein FliQ [Variovorax sp. PvP013]|jgi:flagellar biosynthetic protein FliQ|uniref:flagellar biosynthesis protein FliQ n=1 Tax=Variovorax sp. PvP013 TaxID=3156435 RepID=UPI002CCA6B86|nr:flagellar biosynthesis protein FliQ [Variovorax sp.]
MNPETVVTMGGDALAMLLTVSMPVLLTVLAVGLVVSIFQAVTQINEQTLAFVPKLIAAVAVLVVTGPWILETLVDYIRRVIESIPQMVL